ncbi:hypothetical protein [Deinococcus sp. PEB2-63]
MTHAQLRRTEPEPVVPLIATPGSTGPLGARPPSWTPGPAVQARVTPVTDEQATRAGLTSSITRLRLRFVPPRLIEIHDRWELRGHTWKVVSCEVRTSYSTAIVERVP